MTYPITRLRRLRSNHTLRRMVRETRISPDNLIMPLFVRHGSGIKNEIASMPGQYQFSPDTLAEEARSIEQAGVPAIILFGIPQIKDELGSEAWADEGIICQSIESVKRACPDLCVITDVCMCEYTDHGHCGVVKPRRNGVLDVDNDATIDLLIRQAIAHARAGADMVAPSDMMDGRVGAIRNALDEARMPDVPIMAYSAKFASAFYGPFRDAAESPPQFGDRSSYQMDPANAREAMREIQLDIDEGADIVMVKPALPYLDIIRMARNRFDVPLAAYNVSGEYAMLKSAADNGWIDEKRAVIESLLSIRRAGADLILTYWAKQAAKWLQA
ncbi:MAG TPA: porphobilinogen synthase [Candidatus Bathyarchaeia archaeon]|nr:porphobilinogen synthase [Candidatus Bathyarchaeia archaeon]